MRRTAVAIRRLATVKPTAVAASQHSEPTPFEAEGPGDLYWVRWEKKRAK